jgi:hypothetical protein
MHRARVLWPNLAHWLSALALIAGCSGQEPLQVKTTNPLERDVVVAGGGCDVGCGAQGGGWVIADHGGPGGAWPLAGYGGVAGYGPVAGSAGVVGEWPGSQRLPICGDGVINGIEVCDRSELSGMTCATLGYAGGSLACSPSTCTYDVSLCRSRPPNVGIPWMPVDAGFDDAGVAQ